MTQTKKEFLARAEKVRADLMEASYKEEECNRCEGAGFMTRDDWVATEVDGSCICYACKGYGFKAVESSFLDPLYVRRATVQQLHPLVLDGEYKKLEDLRIIAREGQYWLILWDVFARAESAAKAISADMEARFAEMSATFE